MEPMEVSGGPFDFKVLRERDTISLQVNNSDGEIITQIDFNARKIDNVIHALIKARG